MYLKRGSGLLCRDPSFSVLKDATTEIEILSPIQESIFELSESKREQISLGGKELPVPGGVSLTWGGASERVHGPFVALGKHGSRIYGKKYFPCNETYVPKLKLLYFTDCHFQLL